MNQIFKTWHPIRDTIKLPPNKITVSRLSSTNLRLDFVPLAWSSRRRLALGRENTKENPIKKRYRFHEVHWCTSAAKPPLLIKLHSTRASTVNFGVN